MSDSLDDPRPRQRMRLDHDNLTRINQLERELQVVCEASERNLQLEREARERAHEELQEERAYFNSVLLVIQQQLHLDLPPHPQPRGAPSQPFTLNQWLPTMLTMCLMDRVPPMTKLWLPSQQRLDFRS